MSSDTIRNTFVWTSLDKITLCLRVAPLSDANRTKINWLQMIGGHFPFHNYQIQRVWQKHHTILGETWGNNSIWMTVIFNSDGPSLALISAPAVLTVINMTKRLQDILTVLFDNVFQLITILWISRVKPINCDYFLLLSE